MDFKAFVGTLIDYGVDVKLSTASTLHDIFFPPPMAEWERDLLSGPVTLTSFHDKLVNYAMIDTEILDNLQAGRKIQAIKVLRTRVVGAGLKQAKDAVEDWRVTGLIDPPF
jgi:hypothetical protein